MPSTGFTFAGAGATTTGIGSVEWSNPGNIVSDNGVYASAPDLTNVLTHRLSATNFGFAVPASAQIVGVQVRVECFYTIDSGSPDVLDSEIQLIVGGLRTGNQKTFGNWTVTTPTIQNTGGAADLWGVALTPAIVNASNFGVSVRARNNAAGSQADLFIDYVSINVTYGLGRSQGIIIA